MTHFIEHSLLGCLLALLLVWLLFKPVENSPAANNAASTYKWVSVKQVNVYKKPNIKSKIVGELPAETQLHAVNETNYFIKIKFENSDGASKTGYVVKSLLKKNI